MKHYELVGPKVVQLREQRGLSQADLARAVGIARPSMSQLESGLRQPSAETALKIADVLRVKFSAITRVKDSAALGAEQAAS